MPLRESCAKLSAEELLADHSVVVAGKRPLMPLG